MEVNELQKVHLMPKVKNYFKENIQGKHFAIWGLSFKPNTDDIREAPAFYMIDHLLKNGATVTAFDPEAMENSKKILGNTIQFCDNQYDALKNADALIIATEWNEFRAPDFDKISSLLKNKAIFDGRNLFDLLLMKQLGFHYESVGRKSITQA
jgi:UDPglucose 6-dehydrogenase